MKIPAFNSFRFAVLSVVVVFCMYNYRNSEPGPKRTRLGRAAIANWPPATGTLPLLPDWAGLVDLKTVPDLNVRGALAEACASPDLGCTWSCNGCMAPDDVKTCPDKNTLALSFDDGPSPSTPVLLDLLDKKNIKVTFFVVGNNLLSDTGKATLLRAFKAGHQIASHTWSHRALTTLSNDQVIAEIMWTHELIKSIIGVSPVYIRPPFGDIDNRVRSIMKQLGYHSAIWSHDTFDWQINADPPAVPPKKAADVAADFGKWISDPSRNLGMITLEHDLYAAAVAAVPDALTVIQDSKINLMTVAQCLGRNAYAESAAGTDPTITKSTPNATPPTSTPAVVPKSAAVGTANDFSSMAYFFVATVLCIFAAF